MTDKRTFLVFGATGQTGRQFVDIVLREGHRVRAVVRNPEKLALGDPELEVHQGSITDTLELDVLVRDVNFVIVMLGDAEAQRHTPINTAFVRSLVPAMRRQDVKRLLYQAGGFSTPPGERLSLPTRLMKGTVGRRHLGQHHDNEAVMRYLVNEATDIEWMVHRAALRPGDGTRGVLQRSDRRSSIATFRDCGEYNYRTVMDPAAVHTCSMSRYVK